MRAKAPAAKKAHLTEEDESGEEDALEDFVQSDAESNSDEENDSEKESGDDDSSDDDATENKSSKAAPLENPFFGDPKESGDDDNSEGDDGSVEGSVDSDDELLVADKDLDETIEKSMKVKLGKRKKTDVVDEDSDSDDWDDSDSDDNDPKENTEQAKPEEKNDEEIDKDEEFLKAFREARDKRIRLCPPDIKLKSDPSDISFHPEENILCVANMCGEISFFRYANEENKIERKIKLHSKGIRCVDYSLDGTKIISGGKDKLVKLLDVETGKVLEDLNWKHPSSLYSVCTMDQGVATGDEDGMVKIWDYRKKNHVLKSKRFDEFVSSFYLSEDQNRLMASSGEGTIQSWDLRMNKAEVQSEVYDSELNAVVGIKEDQKMAVASSDGWIYLFGDGEYGYHSDEYRGHPGSINAMIAVTDTVVITGCEDGVLRAVNLYPHRFIGTVGHHQCAMPVEKIEASGGQGNLIASLSHDSKIKFWDIGYFEDMVYKKTVKPFIDKSKHSKPTKNVVAKEREHQLQSSNRQNRADFFKGFED